MNITMKWLAGALVALGLLIGIHDAVAAEPPAAEATAVADPGIWGVYAQLPGTEWNNGNARWQWGPDNTIVESRTFQMKSVIRPGAHRGELVSVYGGGLHTYDGRIAADGSVLWVRRGRFLKMPSRVSIVDGELIEEMVKLDDAGQVAKVGSVLRFNQTGGPKAVAVAVAVAPVVASSAELAVQPAVQPGAVVGAAAPVPMPAAAVPVAPVAAMPSAAPAVSSAGLEQSPLPPPSRELFGPYAEVVGLSHITADGYQIRWYQSSETAVVHEVRAPNGAIENLQIIKTAGHGTLVMLRSGWCPDGVCGQAGTVADGVAHWKEPKASGGYSGGFMDTKVWVENGALVSYMTDPAPSSDLFERFPHLRPGPVRLALVPTPPLTAEQVTESRSRVAQLEPMVELEVAKAISKQLATGQSIADAQAQRQRSAERVRSFNRLMGSVNGVLTEANDIATANEAQSRAELDATLAQINAQAEAQRQTQQQAAEEQQRQTQTDTARRVAEQQDAQPVPQQASAQTPAPQPPSSTSDASPTAATAPGAPLRFILHIALKTVINGVNATCYSNIVTIPGPPGWPDTWNQPGGDSEARALIKAYMPAFESQCSAYGPLVGGGPQFNWNKKGAEHISPESVAASGQRHGQPVVQL